METLTEHKNSMRKALFAARKQAHGSAVGAAEAARDHFLASRLLTGVEVVSGYCPIRTELDVMPLMDALHDAGHRVCVPVIQSAGQALRFHEWWPGVEMQDGPFGAQVPKGTQALEPELVIAPLVGFDRAGWQLGYGGGFYDRSLEALRAKRRTRAFGYAYAAQELDAVPIETTDQRLDGVVTELGVIRPLVEDI